MSDKTRESDDRRGRKTEGYLFKREKTWWACWTYQGERFRQSTGKNIKSEAEVVLEEKIAPFRQREKVDALATLQSRVDRERTELQRAIAHIDRIPLNEVWDRYPYEFTSSRRGSRRRLTPRNIEENRGAWQKFVGFMDGHLPEVKVLEDVTAEHANAYSKYLTDEVHLTAGRHNKLITTARMMFTMAGRPHPFYSVPRYEVRHESREPLEPEQLRDVCSKAAGELRRLFAIMLYTGLRLGDSCTLKWSDIKHGIIQRVMAKTRKTVSFPVHTELQRILDEVPAAERRAFVCQETATLYAREPQDISKRIRKHFEACEISCVEDRVSGKRRISRYGAHSFRHTFITLCARAGVPQGLVRQWVGHASEDVTRIYEHWSPSQEKQRILAALPAVMSGAPALQTPALPTPVPDSTALPPNAREMLSKMTARNWQKIRDALLTAIPEKAPHAS